jgi:hypothetical protein
LVALLKRALFETPRDSLIRLSLTTKELETKSFNPRTNPFWGALHAITQEDS